MIVDQHKLDQVVDSFSYLEDSISAGEGCEAATVITQIRMAWDEF